MRLKECLLICHHRHIAHLPGFEAVRIEAPVGQQIVEREMLCAENPVQGFKRHLPALVQEVGQVRLAKPDLAGEQRDADGPPLNAAKQFLAKTLMDLCEIHLCIFRR